jgi:probable phosphoglycerate mutase
MDFLLIRHGLPVRIDETDGIPDPELSNEGHRQATALAGWLEPVKLDAIWSSPLLRARQTAEPLLASRDLEIQVEPDLEEMDFGFRSYVPYEEAVREGLSVYDRFTKMMANQREYPEFLEFRTRVVRALQRIADASPDGTGLAAVACHGGVINAALSAAVEAPVILSFPIHYTSVTHLRVTRSGRLRAMSANEIAHLGSRAYADVL